LPLQAEIATYVVVDAVGILQLATGEQIRFGRSSCKGFEPVVGAAVILEEVVADCEVGKRRKYVLIRRMNNTIRCSRLEISPLDYGATGWTGINPPLQRDNSPS
jgi:hypothetical protein